MSHFEKHLKHRVSVNKQTEGFSGLTTVELNITELCNRKCSFCPRSNPTVYPNQKLHMSIETVKLIKSQLKNFKGLISICGFGEPTLNPNFLEICSLLSEFNLEVITNGDSLDKKIMTDDIIKTGVNNILISDYDKNPYFYELEKKYDEVKIRRHFDDGSDRYDEYNFTNRAGVMFEESNSNPCYYTAYKIIIDWNGDLILCCNDWLRKQDSFGNIHKEHMLKIWNNDTYNYIRKELLSGNRDINDACRNCNAKGTLIGKESVEYWNAIY
tara:strand:- start:3512 stop:4321 length:810 start_codon:yes stop_codon:yes gene_type:complete